MIADPALDIGMLLYLYIDRQNWDQWLKQYGLHLNDHLLLRMKWYYISQSLLAVQWNKSKNRISEVNDWLDRLSAVII